MKKKVFLGISGTILLIVILLSVSFFPSKNEAFSIPNQIGTYSLISKLEGNEALQQINKLHGKDIKIENGYILEYQNNSQGSAVIWISESSSINEAKQLFNRMNRLMDLSQMYTNHSSVKINGTKVEYVDGMNMGNYYYRKGPQVIWITVSMDNTQDFIKNALNAF